MAKVVLDVVTDKNIDAVSSFKIKTSSSYCVTTIKDDTTE